MLVQVYKTKCIKNESMENGAVMVLDVLKHVFRSRNKVVAVLCFISRDF